MPGCEALDVRLALHPDDPPWKILGIARVVSTKRDIAQILRMAPSPQHGLTLCVGSFASRADNDAVDIAAAFASSVHFVHLRNVKRLATHSFVESNHLDGDVDMFRVIELMCEEQRRRRARNGGKHAEICMRPDHGHLMLGDASSNPGYTLYGRLKGLSELRGIQFAVQSAAQLQSKL